MMKNLIANNISLVFKNPIYLSTAMFILVSLILLVGSHFQVPDYYTDTELADSIAQTVYPAQVRDAVAHLINPKYGFFNTIFQIWGWLAAILSFCLIFKIKEFKQFKELNILNKKPFVYLWINLSYIIFSICFISVNMIDLEKKVYNGAADSFGIPFFTIMAILIYAGAIYYMTMNFLAFITYNTRIKRLFYCITWILIALFWLMVLVSGCTYKFSYWYIALDLYYLIYFALCIYSVVYIRRKEKSV